MRKIFLGLFVLISLIKAEQMDLHKMTLKSYEVQDKKVKLLLNEMFISLNKWDVKLKNEYMNCMDDFTEKKNKQLLFKEVISWCNKKLEKVKVTNYKKPTQYKNAIDALKLFGTFEPVEISKSEFVLYIDHITGEEDYIILEEAKRAFIDATYISFVQTDLKEINLSIIPRENNNKANHKYSFKGSIKKEDAVIVAKKLLQVKSLDELFGSMINDKFYNDTPSPIFNKIRFNNHNSHNLDIYFKELSEKTF